MIAACALALLLAGAPPATASTKPKAAAPAVPAPRIAATRTDESGTPGAPLRAARIDARALTAPEPGVTQADDAASDLATLQAVVDQLYPPGNRAIREKDMSAFLRELP